MTDLIPATVVPEQGQIVSVRQRRYIVSTVEPSTLTVHVLEAGPRPPQHLVTLSSIEDDGLGESLQVVWEAEPAHQIIEQSETVAQSRRKN